MHVFINKNSRLFISMMLFVALLSAKYHTNGKKNTASRLAASYQTIAIDNDDHARDA